MSTNNKIYLFNNAIAILKAVCYNITWKRLDYIFLKSSKGGQHMSNLFVCLMGMGTVFVGLICIVFICMIMSIIIRSTQKTAKTSVAPTGSVSNTPIANKQEIVAAVCAVIAHETGAEAKNIRVLSFKKIG